MIRNGKDVAPASINAFADISFGLKQDFIDNPWYEMMDGAVRQPYQNAIAHYKLEYDEVAQICIYYPKREGIDGERNRRIYFREFMRRLLITYREMRRLHHLIKVLFFYRYLIMKLP